MAGKRRARHRVKSYVFKVAIEPDKFEDGRDAWHAYCPALRGCHTWGHTYEEALANIREAIDLYVQDLLEACQAIPVDQGTIELSEPAVLVHVLRVFHWACRIARSSTHWKVTG